MAAEDQGAAIGGREVDIEHLDGSEFVEHGARREAAGQGLEPGAKGDVQTVSQEGNEDVGLDALLQLMVDGPQLQIVLEVFEGRLDFDEQNVELPQLCGIVPGQIAAEQIAAFAPVDLTQLAAIESIAKGWRVLCHRDADQTPS